MTARTKGARKRNNGRDEEGHRGHVCEFEVG
jgi:hypothetical protein